ncbi:carbohydrate ABC transporter permease [Cohnella hongkongensis]|uniref:Carbohydrate ABC transporter permease n=1 Tax=Cohnella hongkongensis TaxID=178337 RepID=A0ABV9F6Q8_9BACL
MKLTRNDQWAQAIVFIGPGLLMFAIMKLIPFAMGMYYSFTDWNGISDSKNFVGLKNFANLLTDDNFIQSFVFTSKYTIAVLILNNLIAFLLAFLLTRRIRFRNAARVVIFMPNVIGGILLGFIWQFIFVKSFPSIGEIVQVGFFNLPWLGTSTTAFWGVVIVSIWQFTGYLMVIYVAGITSVPHDLMEAAEIDGAGTLRKIVNVILPLIMPVVTVCMFLTISNSFKIFDVIYSLTRGGPFQSTQPVAMDIYYEAYNRNNMGLGSAKAFVFFFVVAAVSLAQVWLTKRKEVK